ncbi:DeoR family transcriptional regulator [Bacillus thuringiensis]|uniref:DeoR family transcriptional regulator n=1 Tax=Bacillus thuringiensis serovar andalousiensis TaxID=257985 RepID=A0A6H0TM23_BACTU|nr:DeoR family transcriptional regulator [Bacillus thuringiensis]QIW21385.1 DeoR family transcriptional regulator [Bacillus thuringiensis serovar andalousiensis]
MAEQLIATVLSQSAPLAGQKNRSSGNFSTEFFPPGTQYLKWVITGGGDPNIISFNVMKDVSAGTDPVVFHDVLSGNRTSVVSARSLYIANPKNALDPFNVSVYAIY